MTDDDQLERWVEARLAATARPMPRRVADAVLQGVEPRTQLPAGSESSARHGRLSLVAAASAAVVVTVAFGLAVLGRLDGRAGPGGVAGAHVPSPAWVWDAMRSFRGSPSETNPSVDGYGNQAVWSYLEGPSGSSDPARYVRLTEFDEGPRDAWVDPASTLAIGVPQGVDRLVLHPATGEAAIVAWRSPYDVAVAVAGSVEADPACGDDVEFWIDRGRDRLETLTVPSGTHEFDRALTVGVGETLYFGVDATPSGSTDCDLTWLRLTISGS